jgi:DNA helicase-2/ATP-dependent DNA helicase PcrA
LPEECLKYLTPKQQPMPSGGGLGGFGSSWGGGYATNSGASRAYSTGATGQFGTYSVPPKEVARKEEPTGLRKGQKVFHAKFGEGTVLTLEGAGDDARAQINFPRHGTKWLALSVAKLTPVP